MEVREANVKRFGNFLAAGLSLAQSARKCRISYPTAKRWKAKLAGLVPVVRHGNRWDPRATEALQVAVAEILRTSPKISVTRVMNQVNGAALAQLSRIKSGLPQVGRSGPFHLPAPWKP